MLKLKEKIFWSIPILFLSGAMMHFAYDILGRFFLAALIAPVNESIFEHLKLSFYPILVWWGIIYLLYSEKTTISKSSLITACFVSCIGSMAFITAFFYAYTGMFGIGYVVLDVISLVMGMAFGQFLGLHIYNKATHKKLYALLCLMGIACVVVIFTLWTFNPPHIPFFMDPITNTFGLPEH